MAVALAERREDPVAVLVDDDRAVREALGDLLNSVGVDTVSFASSSEFLTAELPDRPGCLVLDVRMPGLSGLDLQRHLAEQGITTPIVFLTGHGDIAMSVQAMKSGAVDFLTKPVRDQSFLDAVSRAIAADVTQRDAARETQKNVDLYDSLTPRERQVLRYVVKGLLNKQIAYELEISEVTVKLHRSSMMRKMHAGSAAGLFGAWQSLPAEIRMDDA
ncbi:DNA-binding response regulator [Devosia insulae DS-56]|uniref:DNA-binding response regulator n=1 Tax=Devosia insulae DS-56 TaxID=1116389 RepID=A0A1E5XIT4_9HYPH|nr:response regulator transcription factor [Devosia insulae]OEO28516.1 DNA-binding response regulator [Devosia insulae DS-56]